jgi:hypothetical protein
MCQATMTARYAIQTIYIPRYAPIHLSNRRTACCVALPGRKATLREIVTNCIIPTTLSTPVTNRISHGYHAGCDNRLDSSIDCSAAGRYKVELFSPNHFPKAKLSTTTQLRFISAIQEHTPHIQCRDSMSTPDLSADLGYFYVLIGRFRTGCGVWRQHRDRRAQTITQHRHRDSGI